jgi:hypothetical protein
MVQTTNSESAPADSNRLTVALAAAQQTPFETCESKGVERVNNGAESERGYWNQEISRNVSTNLPKSEITKNISVQGAESQGDSQNGETARGLASIQNGVKGKSGYKKDQPVLPVWA